MAGQHAVPIGAHHRGLETRGERELGDHHREQRQHQQDRDQGEAALARHGAAVRMGTVSVCGTARGPAPATRVISTARGQAFVLGRRPMRPARRPAPARDSGSGAARVRASTRSGPQPVRPERVGQDLLAQRQPRRVGGEADRGERRRRPGGEGRRERDEGEPVRQAFEQGPRLLLAVGGDPVREGAVERALEQHGQAPRVIELRGPLLAPLPGRQSDAEPAEHDDQHRGDDAERQEHLEQREAARSRRPRGHGSGASATARRLASSSARLLPQRTATESA